MLKNDLKLKKMALVSEIGELGLEKLRNANVLCIGMGGGGCVGAHQLAMINVGQLILCDHDTVSESNLGRQFLYRKEDIGKLKVDVAARELMKLNPELKIKTVASKISMALLDILRAEYPNLSVYIAVDKWVVHLEVNQYCIENKLSCMHIGSMGFKGFVYNFRPDMTKSCLKCLLNGIVGDLNNVIKLDKMELPYFPPTISVVGAIGVVEIAKNILESNDKSMANQLIIYRAVDKVDIFDRSPHQFPFFQQISLQGNDQCQMCIACNNQNDIKSYV